MRQRIDLKIGWEYMSETVVAGRFSRLAVPILR